MSSPISQYGYLVNENVVTFTSLSLNTNQDTIYHWEFGDGNTSSEENPVHTYIEPIFYEVTLTTTNPGLNPSSSATLLNLTGAPNPIVFNDIPKIIDLYTPTAIVGTIKNHAQKQFLISKWQCYLQPLLFNPTVSSFNTYNVNSYPPLANSLIAKLVVIDIIEMEATAFLIDTANSGNTNTQSIENTIANSSGGVKSIETGPTKVERYENKDISSNSEKVANLAKTYQSLITSGGVLDQLKSSACQDSQRIQVYLPMCGQLKVGNQGFSVTGKVDKGLYAANPFGYTENQFGITDRMT